MANRLDVNAASPKLYQALYGVSLGIAEELPGDFKHLLDLRVSQINGCRYCIDLHTGWARRDGVPAERVEAVAGWRESALFTPDERAALAWAEALTRHQGDLDALHADLLRHYSPAQVGALTMAVAVINAWNRVGIAQHREAA